MRGAVIKAYRSGLLLALGAAAALSTFGASAQVSQWYRSIGVPPKPVASKVAKTAEPFVLTPELEKRLQGLTYGEVVERLCGSIPEGYEEHFQSLNAFAFDPNKRVEKDGDIVGVVWPACLWARAMRIDPDYYEDWDNLYPSLIGFNPDPNDIPDPPGANNLYEVSSAVQLRFKNEETAKLFGDFVSRKENSNSISKAQPAVGEASNALGLILPKSDRDCISIPSDAASVAKAYLRSRSRRKAAGFLTKEVEVLIVDNGFLGLRCDPVKGCPITQEDGRFTEVFGPFFTTRNKNNKSDELIKKFKKYYDVGIGGEVYYKFLSFDLPNPNNYGYVPVIDYLGVGSPSEIFAGHGTHVAGLVIGGPDFQPFREETLTSDTEELGYWLDLVVLAAANGTRDVDINSIAVAISNYSSDAGVVNLSLGFKAKGKGNTDTNWSRLQEQFAEQTKPLFVVAAGNSGLPASRIFPALMGFRENFLTVAALEAGAEHGDAPRLLPSSNYGDEVALAAPGCKIESWVTGAPERVAMTGTSQAAPQVSFIAALLRSLMPRKAPAHVKNRLILSGDYLPCTEINAGKKCVKYRVSLNGTTALLFQEDVLVTNEGGARRTYVGNLDVVIPNNLDEDAKCSRDKGRYIHSLKRVTDSDDPDTFRVYCTPKFGEIDKILVQEVKLTDVGFNFEVKDKVGNFEDGIKLGSFAPHNLINNVVRRDRGEPMVEYPKPAPTLAPAPNVAVSEPDVLLDP